MSISMSSLVSDAKELVMRLKEREKNVDQVVIQSNALAKKVDAIQQLETELMNLNEKANHRSKVAVLSSIQKESKVIKLLQQENDELKESLEEHQSVLELIMSKYRQQMLQLILLKKQQEASENFYYTNLVKNLQEKTDKIAEMGEVMRRAVELDDRNLNESEEFIQSLLIENDGLKELLRIKNRYGINERDPNEQTKSKSFVDSEVQTDDTLFELNVSTQKMADNEAETSSSKISTSPNTSTSTTVITNESPLKQSPNSDSKNSSELKND